jgi:hypothetical protein
MSGIDLKDAGKAKLYVIGGKLQLRKKAKGNVKNIAAYAQKMKTVGPQCAAESRGKPKGAYKSCVRTAMSR